MSWIFTKSGKQMNLLEPDPDVVDIEDIARALGNLCRFTGHSDPFYSVAEHSIHVASACCAEHKLHGLLHDAAEAYMGDIARPLKRQLPNIRAIEERLLFAIFKKLGLKHTNCSCIKDADELMLVCEVSWFFGDEALQREGGLWKPDLKPLPPEVLFWRGWGPRLSRNMFLHLYERYASQ